MSTLPILAGGSVPVAERTDVLRSAIDYAAAEKSPATLRAYASDWRHYEAWCKSERFAPLPTNEREMADSTSVLAAYLAHLADAGLKANTINRRTAAITYAFRKAGLLEAAAATYCLLGAPAYADRGDIVGSTRAINGGLNGLADRRAALALGRKVWPRVPMLTAAAAPPTTNPAPARPAAPIIPLQTKEAIVPVSRMPIFLAAFLGLLGLGPAQAAPSAAAASLDAGLLAFALMAGILAVLSMHRALPRLRFGQALKLAGVFLLLGAGAAHAATVDFSPLVQAAISDLAVPVLMAVAPTVAAILVLPLKRFLDQRSALDMSTRVNDLLDKAIASGARAANAKWAAGTLDVDVDGFVASTAAAYANAHAPQLMQRAAGAAGPALEKLLREKVEARLDSNPDHLALKASIAAAGAPLQLAGAA